jgi:hypothetical protein
MLFKSKDTADAVRLSVVGERRRGQGASSLSGTEQFRVVSQ